MSTKVEDLDYEKFGKRVAIAVVGREPLSRKYALKSAGNAGLWLIQGTVLWHGITLYNADRSPSNSFLLFCWVVVTVLMLRYEYTYGFKSHREDEVLPEVTLVHLAGVLLRSAPQTAHRILSPTMVELANLEWERVDKAGELIRRHHENQTKSTSGGDGSVA
jgi:hypothetical protein